MPPQITPNVNTGNAMIVVRYARRSSTSAAGTRDASQVNLVLSSSYCLRIRYRMLATPGTRNRPDAVAAAVTCTTSQYDWRAGMTGAASAYRTVPPRNIRITTGSSTNPDTRRTGNLRISTTQVAIATNVTRDMYSYMFPQGARPVATPRSTIDTKCTSTPRTSRDPPIRPIRSARVRSGRRPGTNPGASPPVGTVPPPTVANWRASARTCLTGRVRPCSTRVRTMVKM